eukprot:254875-Rhodomonas_salina.3
MSCGTTATPLLLLLARPGTIVAYAWYSSSYYYYQVRYDPPNKYPYEPPIVLLRNGGTEGSAATLTWRAADHVKDGGWLEMSR